ncbi:MAG: GNAT family N-acetyltransferase [Thermoplasmatota archaeon]
MKYEFKILRADRLDEWMRYYERIENKGVYHHPRYINLMADHFEGEPELLIYGKGDHFIYYPYYKRKINELNFIENKKEVYDIISSWYYGGPILSDPGKEKESLINQFNEKLQSKRKEDNIVSEFVRFDPLLENHKYFTALKPEIDRNTVYVKLDQTEKEIWNNFESRNRRAIKQAKDTDIEIEQSKDLEEMKKWSKIYSNAMESRDAADHYRFSFDFFKTLLVDNNENFDFLVAKYHREIIGGFLIAYDDEWGHHYLSASNPDYWDKRVNNLMFYNVILHSKEKGLDIFDFQGGRPGVYKFKKGFSPTRGEFYLGKVVHDEKRYDELVKIAEEAGKDTDEGFFPQYRTR